MNTYNLAPELITSQWFNSDPISLQSLRGKVVVIEAFQMLCPGCVSHGIPQVQRIQQTFTPDQVVVLGLHTVFEHHDAMTPVSLQAFLHEYRITFPVGVDLSDGEGIPATMKAYAMQGTPTLIIIDAKGQFRHQLFGRPADLLVGAKIMALIKEGDSTSDLEDTTKPDSKSSCDDTGCTLK